MKIAIVLIMAFICTFYFIYNISKATHKKMTIKDFIEMLFSASLLFAFCYCDFLF